MGIVADARIGVAVLAIVLTAACGGASEEPAEPVTFDAPSATATPSASPALVATDPATLLPLTGASTADAALRTRPVVATVVRFGPGAAPVGLGGADIVYQEPGRGAESRLVVLYHSQDAARVGPIGATQPSDAGLLGLLKPAYAHSGGADRLVTRLNGTGLVQLSPARSAGVFSTANSGFHTATATLRKRAGAGTGRPLQLLVYGEVGQPLAPATGTPTTVRSLTVTVPGQPAQVWTRDAAGGWVQSGAGAPRVRVANLLIQQTVYRELRSDKAGNTVREANVFGKGPVTAISGEQLVQGGWTRPGANATANYADTAGVPLRLAPGATWILLAPAGTAVVPTGSTGTGGSGFGAPAGASVVAR